LDEVNVLQRTEEASLDITLGDQVCGFAQKHAEGGCLQFLLQPMPHHTAFCNFTYGTSRTLSDLEYRTACLISKG
jgi:hypothetical protein